ncbi:MAG: Gfo/Idh/MocA family oxidoreductase [Promethearchaeota archaeon]
MSKEFDVLQVGFGPMGRLIAKLLIKRKNINLKGVVDINPNLIGRKIDQILDLKERSDLTVSSDLDDILSNEKIDVVFIATSSSLEEITPMIKKAILSGSNVISICEELIYPFHFYPKLSEELDALAKANNVSVIGTGINPGYLMDLLPIVITAPCQKVNSIKVTRIMNSAKRRESFQRKIGTGLSSQEFHQKISKKEITGHVGLKESIQIIVAALSFQYDDIIEFPPEEIIAEKEFITSYGEKVSEGYVCGLKSKAIAKRMGEEVIVLDFIAFAGEHEEYDSIEIEGIPNIHQKIIGGVHGDIGTAAIVANLIPKVISANSGLLTMKDIPVPCYTENVWKN